MSSVVYSSLNTHTNSIRSMYVCTSMYVVDTHTSAIAVPISIRDRHRIHELLINKGFEYYFEYFGARNGELANDDDDK